MANGPNGPKWIGMMMMMIKSLVLQIPNFEATAVFLHLSIPSSQLSTIKKPSITRLAEALASVTEMQLEDGRRPWRFLRSPKTEPGCIKTCESYFGSMNFQKSQRFSVNIQKSQLFWWKRPGVQGPSHVHQYTVLSLWDDTILARVPRPSWSIEHLESVYVIEISGSQPVRVVGTHLKLAIGPKRDSLYQPLWVDHDLGFEPILYPLVIQHSYWRMTIYSWFTSWKWWWFSIAMLN